MRARVSVEYLFIKKMYVFKQPFQRGMTPFKTAIGKWAVSRENVMAIALWRQVWHSRQVVCVCGGVCVCVHARARACE